LIVRVDEEDVGAVGGVDNECRKKKKQGEAHDAA
jgi:hypothetical protein